jgi:hypothetical protein
MKNDPFEGQLFGTYLGNWYLGYCVMAAGMDDSIAQDVHSTEKKMWPFLCTMRI